MLSILKGTILNTRQKEPYKSSLLTVFVQSNVCHWNFKNQKKSFSEWSKELWGRVQFWRVGRSTTNEVLFHGWPQCHVDYFLIVSFQTSTFKTPRKTRCVTKQVAKVKRSSVRKGDTDVWMCDQLVVPPLPPSYLHGCGIIDVKYTLEVNHQLVSQEEVTCSFISTRMALKLGIHMTRL